MSRSKTLNINKAVTTSKKSKRKIRNQQKQLVFNWDIINKNQRKCKFLRKILNKIIKVTDRDYSLRSLKNCASRNFANMHEEIKKLDKTNRDSSISRKQSRSNLNSSSASECSSSKKRKRSKNETNRDIAVESVNITSNKNIVECEDLNENSKIIRNLVEKQKKLIFSEEDQDGIVFNNPSDSDTEQKGNSKTLDQKKLRVRNTRTSIKKLRKLPNYKEIDEILNAPKKSIYTKRKGSSLNSVTWHKTETREHWTTYTYLSEKIEQCVLNRKWNHLTKLLKLLTDAPKWYRPFLLRATIINLICNPLSKDDESTLEEFLKSGFSCQSDDDIREALTNIFHISTATLEESTD